MTIRNLTSSETEYEIVEVNAPAGYVIENSTPVTFKVTVGQVTDRDLSDGVEYKATDNDFIIPNTPGAALPNTGGPGTTLFYLVGLLLTALAGGGILMKRRRRETA